MIAVTRLVPPQHLHQIAPPLWGARPRECGRQSRDAGADVSYGGRVAITWMPALAFVIHSCRILHNAHQALPPLQKIDLVVQGRTWSWSVVREIPALPSPRGPYKRRCRKRGSSAPKQPRCIILIILSVDQAYLEFCSNRRPTHKRLSSHVSIL